jgi:hypothetical protein
LVIVNSQTSARSKSSAGLISSASQGSPVKRCIVMRTAHFIAGLALVNAMLATGSSAWAQQFPPVDGRQFPLNQMSPPGTSAQWAINAARVTPNYFQPVRVLLHQPGTVTFYESIDRPVELAAPAQASLIVGRTYRMKLSGLEHFPGVDFFPSIELIDRLHPPAGREEDYPIDFEFTQEELEWAANGRLVTKVVYLEQPQRIPTVMLDRAQRIQTIEPSRDVLAEADSLGRPMAIVRLGGRTPDPHRPDPVFFQPGGPVRVTMKPAPAEVNQTSTQPAPGRLPSPSNPTVQGAWRASR